MLVDTVVVAHKVNKKSLLRKCIREGMEMVEFDVTLENGRLVVRHDADVGGTGFRSYLLKIGYRVVEGRDPLCRPSTLEEFLRLVDGRVGVWLDLKSKGVEKEVVATARSFGASRIVVSSGFHHMLRYAKEASKEVTVMLGNVSYRPADPIKEVELAGADGLSIHYSFVDGDLVEALHSVGYKVAVWTVNSVARAIELAKLRVDYVITDVPTKVKAALQRYA